MLLIHQIGSVRVGETVRYTLTYTPSLDRILPPPTHLHVKIKNTSAIPLRVAYLHGPYTLYVSCAPSTFNPNIQHHRQEEHGSPDYEPQLKAGGSWSSKLKVPTEVREDAHVGHHQHASQQERKSFTWLIEVASQVLFSTTASVHYELLVGRDEQSVLLGVAGVMSSVGAPGRLEDHQHNRTHRHAHTKGVFTKAVKLLVEDTLALWSKPAFPGTEGTKMAEMGPTTAQEVEIGEDTERPRRKKRKKIHLVVVTHGLHSNLGADMLYIKESIDATAEQARIDARRARKERRRKRESLLGRDRVNRKNMGDETIDAGTELSLEVNTALADAADQDDEHGDGNEDEDSDDDEHVIVRGFNGNAVKTEKGIQYLGKRLAKYVLSITYPDQPYLPMKSTITQSIVRSFTDQSKPTDTETQHPAHKGSTIVEEDKHRNHNLPYQITKISFVGHSLGGLVQTYAVAYIQKHSPGFFDKIEPVNFIGLASPFLGLSNENPMYVKFALDFGLVGRTGQDLGLTWRAPTMAKNGWVAMVSGFSAPDADKQPDPGTKPLLRILPTGPAHVALRRFRNRSVYSNVVNDGIVPLRTSCLLFLDWRGLGKVEKARRENGLVGTMINWGLSEVTGQNASTPRRTFFDELFGDSDAEKVPPRLTVDPGLKVPAAEASQGLDAEMGENEQDPRAGPSLKDGGRERTNKTPDSQTPSVWATLTSFFRPHAGHANKPPVQSSSSTMSSKQQKAYSRGQTSSTPASPVSRNDSADPLKDELSQSPTESGQRRMLVRGSSLYTNDSSEGALDAPPRTTVFESAGDLLNPPLPPKEFILSPAARPRTIFHDRVYHPEDIPPPAAKHQPRTIARRTNSRDKVSNNAPNQNRNGPPHVDEARQSSESSSMRIEEKIARAYHKDMSWRKVLVRLEPDAHNNIIVRRQFANAYGWPVVKHLCDTHFGYTDAAQKPDDEEESKERAKADKEKAGHKGEEVHEQTKVPDGDEIDSDAEEQAGQGQPNDGPARSRSMPDDGHSQSVDSDRTGREVTRQESSAQYLTAPRLVSRTSSERREAADTISDLTSMVSATGAPASSYSGASSTVQTSLTSLTRRDSGRWSDRFFNNSEDGSDEEDEGLNSELARAYDRGQRYKHVVSSTTPHAPRTVPGHTVPVESMSVSLCTDKYLPHTPLVMEPEGLDAETTEDANNISNNESHNADEDSGTCELENPGHQEDTREKEPTHEISSSSKLGLSASLGRHVLAAPGGRTEIEHEGGVAQHVARARARTSSASKHRGDD